MDISQLFISLFILLVLFIVVGILCSICCRHQNIMRSSSEVGDGAWSEYPTPNIVPSAAPQPPPERNEIFIHDSPPKNTAVQGNYFKTDEDIVTCENGGGYLILGDSSGCDANDLSVFVEGDNIGDGVWSEYPTPNIVPSAAPQPPPERNEIFHDSPPKNTAVQGDYFKNDEDIATCENGGGYLILGDSSGGDANDLSVFAEGDNIVEMCDSGGGGDDADTCTETE